MILKKINKKIRKVQLGKIATPSSRNFIHKILQYIICSIIDHSWETYGWTGNTFWPTRGKKCRICKLKVKWDNYIL